MLDDATLVRQTLDGDQSAFEKLVQRYEGTALALASQYTRDVNDAEDIMQESFISAYINLPYLTDASCFKSWFFQIVVNQAKMHSRRQIRRSNREEIAGKNYFNPPVDYDRFIESLAWRDIIEKAMNSLSISDRAIAILYFFDDHICREVADILGLPLGTVKRRLHKIRKVLVKEVRIMLNEKGVLKYNVGIETLGGIFIHLFEKGTPLPASVTKIFTSAQDKQKEIDFHLLEGDKPFASECRSLGWFTIKGFTVAPQGIPEIAVAISIAKDGTLSIRAVEKPQEKQVIIEAKAENNPIVSVQNV